MNKDFFETPFEEPIIYAEHDIAREVSQRDYMLWLRINNYSIYSKTTHQLRLE